MPLSTIFLLYRAGEFYFVEETRVTEKKVTDHLYHIMYRVHLAWAVLELTTLENQEKHES
jgi:hypothetical protein